ncbi:hypothetical protein TRIUR3_09739 [Triticum urartu]|uniref:Uncharacterized protein n=1 Tax=Triticum urartu TaxID=4572 RepID=M7YR19_TRIUA|nr:hypothetical protein TRIUR3_09739 [Triticum urartu]
MSVVSTSDLSSLEAMLNSLMGRSGGGEGAEDDAAAEVSASVAELERKAAEAEARLRQKEEENAALRRRIESYHIRWLEFEIRIKSLEEDFHEQLASLQMARDAARIAQELPYVDLHEFSEPRMMKLPGRISNDRVPDAHALPTNCARGRRDGIAGSSTERGTVDDC